MNYQVLYEPQPEVPRKTQNAEMTHYPRWLGYFATIALEAILTLILSLLPPSFPLYEFPIPYVLLTMLVALLFGEGPAILAFVLGFFAFDYFFIPPLYTIFPQAETQQGWTALTAYLIGSAIVGFATIMMRRARQRIQRIANQLREIQQDLNRAQAVAHTGSWRLDVQKNVLIWSDEVYRIFGIPRGTPMTYEKFLECVHPEDREYVDRKWKAALQGEPYDIEHRIIVDGKIKWVRERAELEFDEQGRLRGGFGTVQDITDLKLAEEAIRESEEHKIEFYRRTIMAATEGKLIITEHSEIEKIAGPPLATWEIKTPEDLRTVRHGAEEMARSMGMDEEKISKFVVSIGEAATNALKHSGGGTATIHRTQNGLMVVISDKGPGIAALSLPDIALTKGYSTAGTLGMGYKVMISFSDRVYLATGPEGTTVGIEMNLSDVEKSEVQSAIGAAGLKCEASSESETKSQALFSMAPFFNSVVT